MILNILVLVKSRLPVNRQAIRHHCGLSILREADSNPSQIRGATAADDEANDGRISPYMPVEGLTVENGKSRTVLSPGPTDVDIVGTIGRQGISTDFCGQSSVLFSV